MFDPRSRYYNLEIATLEVSDSQAQPRKVPYLRRRFIPRFPPSTTLVEHKVTQGDRLDNITARYLGEPREFWQLCDTNNVLRPDELEETGRTIKIALPFS